MRVLAYCLVPNHFHLALWPAKDGDLSRWMHRLLTTHVRRYQRHYSGHIWQGRFKAFPVQEDDHLRSSEDTILNFSEFDSTSVTSPRRARIFWKFSGRSSRLVDVARALFQIAPVTRD